jgi:membrane-bound lytic murein transglycosylase MltF
MGMKEIFDWLLITAQACQESQLDQGRRSPVGAIGIMQVRPQTAAGSPFNINYVEGLDTNIHAGIKYLRYLQDRYFAGGNMDSFNRQEGESQGNREERVLLRKILICSTV